AANTFGNHLQSVRAQAHARFRGGSGAKRARLLAGAGVLAGGRASSRGRLVSGADRRRLPAGVFERRRVTGERAFVCDAGHAMLASAHIRATRAPSLYGLCTYTVGFTYSGRRAPAPPVMASE